MSDETLLVHADPTRVTQVVSNQLNSAARRPISRRILVADDNRDAAIAMAKILTIKGNDVRTAHDGQEALAVAADFRPEVVLLDLGMPKLNGYDACRRIREQPWSSDVVMIAVTGWGQEGDRARSRDSGFDHHLVKPVDIATLDELLAGLDGTAKRAPRERAVGEDPL